MLLISSCVSTSQVSYHAKIPKKTYNKIVDQKDFDSGWWLNGEVHFHDGTVYYGEIARVHDNPMIKFRKADFREIYTVKEITGYIYSLSKDADYTEDADYTFVFKDVDLRPNVQNIKILEVYEYGDIILYRDMQVHKDYAPGGNINRSTYYIIFTFYIEHDGEFKRYRDFKKDLLPLIDRSLVKDVSKIQSNVVAQVALVKAHNIKLKTSL